MSRADKILPSQKIPEYYSDFLINMDRNAITGQLGRATNAAAVKQALVALVLTSQKERPYQPWLGSRIRESLFENADDELVIDAIKDSIRNCLQANDKRAAILKINVEESVERNGYNVEIWFSIINITEPQVATVFLERVR
jgi:phage baseplate assembly protein W